MFINKNKIITITILLISNLILANTLFANDKDTLKTKLPELKVSADRLLSNSSFKFTAVNIISKKTIENLSPWQLPEILDLSPGIFINNYGGLGGLKTISIRGTSSNQALVMINGVKINSTQSGIFDFSNFPASFFSDIEIVRGGASSLFGGNAIGGIINLRTKKVDPEKIIMSAGYKLGSFNQTENIASLSFKVWGISNSLFYNHTNSKGDYPVKNENGDFWFNRENAQFDNYSVGLINNFKIKTWKNSLITLINWSDRGIPGAVIQEQTQIYPSHQNLKEKSAIIIFNSKKELSDNTDLNIGINSQIDFFDYYDPDFLGDLFTGLKSRFTNRNIGFSARLSTIISSFVADFGLESSFSDLRGNQLDKSVGDYIKRSNVAVFGRAESEVDLFNALKMSYNFGMRLDYFSDIYTALSPMAAVIFQYKDLPFSLKFNSSYNFRPPSFNEMYYLNFGNSDLKPERSYSYNLDFTWIDNDLFQFTYNMFYLNTNNQIVAIPKNQISWSAQNIANVKTKGIEININSIIFDKDLKFILSYTLQKAIDDNKESVNYRKMIAYVPEEIISMTLNYKFNQFDMGTVFKYSSFYYSLPDNSYKSLMSAYDILNAYLIYNLKRNGYIIQFRLDCNNLLDEQYSVIRNYPMPGIYFRFGSSIIFN